MVGLVDDWCNIDKVENESKDLWAKPVDRGKGEARVLHFILVLVLLLLHRHPIADIDHGDILVLLPDKLLLARDSPGAARP